MDRGRHHGPAELGWPARQHVRCRAPWTVSPAAPAQACVAASARGSGGGSQPPCFTEHDVTATPPRRPARGHAVPGCTAEAHGRSRGPFQSLPHGRPRGEGVFMPQGAQGPGSRGPGARLLWPGLRAVQHPAEPALTGGAVTRLPPWWRPPQTPRSVLPPPQQPSSWGAVACGAGRPPTFRTGTHPPCPRPQQPLDRVESRPVEASPRRRGPALGPRPSVRAPRAVRPGQVTRGAAVPESAARPPRVSAAAGLGGSESFVSNRFPRVLAPWCGHLTLRATVLEETRSLQGLLGAGWPGSQAA